MGTYWRPEILSKVVRLLKAGELYLFAGAGLSSLAGYPCWEKLLERFADCYMKLPQRKEEIAKEMDVLVKDKNPSILTHLTNLGEAGEDAFVKVLEDVFCEEKTSKMHKDLVGMPFAGIITTNYDRCFEVACEEVSGAADLVSDRWFCFPKHRSADAGNIDEICGNGRFLLHMHGCCYHKRHIDSKNLVLRRAEYHKFYKTNEMKMIYEDILSKAVLALGTSFTDPYFLNALYNSRGHHDRDLRFERKKWYLLLPHCERPRTECSDSSEYGVEFNYFDESDALALEKMVGELKDTYEKTAREPKGRERWK